MDDNKTLTYGERAVGIKFNPGNNEWVERVKKNYAKIIDQLKEHRDLTDDPEQKRLLSIAITEAQGAQMWAVKGITWEV